MSKNPRRLMRRIGGLALASVAAAASIIFPAAAAHAAGVACPSATMSSPAISSWQTDYRNHGITLCTGLLGAGNVVVKVQIIDLAGGAGVGQTVDPATYTSNPADNTFNRYSIGSWGSQYNVTGGYGSSYFFSATNGAFFTSTTTPTTKISLPVKVDNVQESHGFALHGTDPAWNTPKRVLYMEPTPNGPSVRSFRITSFPTFYTAANAACGNWDDCVVGFDPLQDPTGNSANTAVRTFIGSNAALGSNATRAYILTSSQMLTVAQATAVLKHFGSQSEMQLDGGGSTSMASFAGNMQPVPGNRAVPHVLLTSYAP